MDDAVAVEPSVGRDFERRDPAETPDRTATTGEQMLAGVIADYWKPVAPGDDLYADAGDEDVEAIARAHIYRILTGRSFHELERHLAGSPSIRRLLGVGIVLDHNSYSRSWRVQFSETNRHHLRTVCETIQERLADLDVAEVEPFLADEDRDYTGRERLTDAQKRRCTNNVWGLFDDDLLPSASEALTLKADAGRVDGFDPADDAAAVLVNLHAILPSHARALSLM